jgi:hypothetical protein
VFFVIKCIRYTKEHYLVGADHDFFFPLGLLTKILNKMILFINCIIDLQSPVSMLI